MHGNMTMTTSTSEADVLGLAAAARFDAMTTTLVLGSTGKTGRWVVQRLAASGIPSRVALRSGEPPFDWEDRSTWAPFSKAWDRPTRPTTWTRSRAPRRQSARSPSGL
jgi:hypothetical protein